ncbi:DNA-binding SARP family transcriptional activator [Amycolatopsis bartoniae]|uniref:SARP family transcriptional regulator n=1 Tax=Amycolatopsis bartoniae TaxID=941986 RepID=A0A8H9IUD8_9PSEU|nr:BTAD domain-containing putative transcriptional regulator [Amycolatopsis bartoniae]MBB2940114.1 DNA-binding SARP family transcriptional activator [Amycolatopsis bartoniae]TVT07707.1 tetratricopeptide repeat protein [Amycolatopsis bartoniae]GHF54064.1 SARP family transcriptional regulator [Amycolatopsis bartoniae]
MRFELLGPVRVTVDGRPVSLGGTKQRMLLAHLLLNAGRQVTSGQLIDVLWGEDPPASAAANLQTYVWRLRQRLVFTGPGEGLLTRDGSYTLVLPEGALDVDRFRELRASAGRERDPEVALAALRAADELWRGDPLADLPPVPAWEAELGRLSESRLAATEERLELLVRLGRPAAALDELALLLDEHPYRERLWQQYLLALAAAGRRAEALAAYTTIRGRLAGDLGVEPGPALREVQAAILRGDPPAAEPARPGPLTGIRQLPADIADFTGRAEAVETLLAALAPRPGGVPPVAVVSGPPGTGKSALALHVAHLLRATYPDGQLYADLGATGDRPADPAAVLGDFLHALGVFGAALPAGATARAAQLRSRLAGRRVLVLLDDAVSAAQVRPLLPADGGCAVLVTSRSRLPDLVGAHHVELGVFAEAEARRLLSAIAGEARVAAEPRHAADIVEFCGHLPLAIRIAGARLAGRQAWPLGTLRDRLAGESGRLGELRVGDLAVRSSFELSVRQLPPDGVLAFGRLALLAGREFPAWSVDALLGRPAHDVLDVLVDASLLAPTGPGPGGQPLYRLHDLIHCYAVEVAGAEPAAGRDAAFRRSVSALLSLAKRAAQALPPAFGALCGEPVGWTLPPETERQVVAEPLGWFAGHRPVLGRTVELAADAGLAELAWQLAASTVPFHDLRGHYDDWRRGHLRALDAVRAAGHRFGEAALLRGLGQVHLYHDEYPEAAVALTRSAELFAGLGERRGEALAVAGLGTLARVGDRPGEALRHYRRALDGLVAVGDRGGEAQMHNALGSAHLQLGQWAEAARRLAAALRVARELGDSHREARVLTELGTLHRLTGELPESLAGLRAALAILEDLHDERCTAYALLGIGQTLLAGGELAHARGLGERALRVFQETANRLGEANALALLDQCRRALARGPWPSPMPATGTGD